MLTPGGGIRRSNPYENPELFQWLDSYEGVPEWTDPAETREERERWARWQQRANELFEMGGTVLPGLVLAITLALLGSVIARWFGVTVLGFERSPLSAILVAIALGLLLRNGIGLPVVYDAGLRLALKRVLRVGVALLGIRLSLASAGAIGLAALPIVVGCITAALLLVSWLSRRIGLPGRLGILIAVGTSICGNTAIVATGPVIGADEDETSYAVGCITVFGLIALMTYPFVSHALFAGDAKLAGLFLGTAIHDTAQVAGAGLMYLQQYGTSTALDTATVTKLVRNLFMLAVIPLMAVLYNRGDGRERAAGAKLSQLVPLFVFGFIAMTTLRTIGDLGDQPFGLLSQTTWDSWVSTASSAATWCLAIAMASVGLGTSFSKLSKLGLRPLAVGLIAAVLVGGVSFGLIRLLAGAGLIGGIG
jgi:uncharacterized integral membrane protein (TIGR00698 family)